MLPLQPKLGSNSTSIALWTMLMGTSMIWASSYSDKLQYINKPIKIWQQYNHPKQEIKLLPTHLDFNSKQLVKQSDHKLLDSDIKKYREALHSIQKLKFNNAEQSLASVKNTVLLPYMEAQRFLASKDETSSLRISTWFKANHHFPIATKLFQKYSKYYTQELSEYKNEINKRQSFNVLTDSPKEILRQLTTGKPHSYNYRDHISARDLTLWQQVKSDYKQQNYKKSQKKAKKIIARSGQKSISAYWLAGLSAWHLEDYNTAEKYFSTIALDANINKKLKPEEAASFMFWAYRSNQKLGHENIANQFLRMAAKHPKSFYGMMALAKSIDNQTPLTELTAQDINNIESGNEIFALNAIGETSEAQNWLNTKALETNEQSKKQQLQQLAKLIDKQTAPVAIAEHWLNHASNKWNDGYPIPKWTNRLQWRSDKALVLAIVRQESNFKENAGSNMGAQGLMQILPSTANYMIKKENALSVTVASAGKSAYRSLHMPSYDLKKARYNLTIGQAFLRHLKKRPYIGTKLPLIAAAYNAGAGNLRKWQKRMDTTDTLLFIESIPITETRNYIKNVSRNYWIYDFMLNESTTSAAKMADGVMMDSVKM